MQDVGRRVDDLFHSRHILFGRGSVRNRHAVDLHTAQIFLDPLPFLVQHEASVRIALILCCCGFALHLLIDAAIGRENFSQELFLIFGKEELTDKLPGGIFVRTA